MKKRLSRLSRRSRLSVVVLASASLGSAHLDSLFAPVAGQVYKAGDVMAIKWTIGNNHNGIDVHLSIDDRTWTVVAADLGKTATAYNWKVPGLATERARIRICQKSGPQGCTDADSLSNPTDGPLYTLVSGRFRIETTSAGLIRTEADYAGPVGKSSGSGTASPAFGLETGPGWFDLRGRRMARAPGARPMPLSGANP